MSQAHEKKPRFRAMLCVGAFVLAALGSSCAEIELDPEGPYGDCSNGCKGWSWSVDGSSACICTPECTGPSGCPLKDELDVSCQPQDDPSPAICVIVCESDNDCPSGLVCHDVGGCLWPS